MTPLCPYCQITMPEIYRGRISACKHLASFRCTCRHEVTYEFDRDMGWEIRTNIPLGKHRGRWGKAP